MNQFSGKHEIGQYLIQSQLGKGTFGTVYKVLEQIKGQTQKQNHYYAMKTQNINALKPMIHLETQILDKLNQIQQISQKKGYSFPKILEYKEDVYLCFMVMEMLDITLQEFANKQMKNTFSKDCLIRVFYNILKIVQKIHELGYLHRDIKPSNFMLKLNKIYQQDSNKMKYLPIIYPIDLGLCKKYLNSVTHKHISCKQNKKMIGTPLFCSLNTHRGLQQSRRDDIQGIIYMIVYLVKKLPWENVMNKTENKIQIQLTSEKYKHQIIRAKNEQKSKIDQYEQVYRIKQSINFDKFLKDPQILPECILRTYKMVLKLQFEEKPDYEQMYNTLEKQHEELTGKGLNKRNCECRWQNMMKKKQSETNMTKNEDKGKKIKINFKIPQSKLKKVQKQKDKNGVINDKRQQTNEEGRVETKKSSQCENL